MLVLTVPHAKCPPLATDAEHLERHLCDRLSVAPGSVGAEAAAAACAELFDGVKADAETGAVFGVEVVLGDVPRTVIDLNRRHARSTLWRWRVDALLGACSAHIDVHSYPPDYMDFAEYELVVMSPSNLSGRLGKAVLLAGLEAGLRVAEVERPETADITIRAAELGCMYTVMVEVNEGISPARIQTVARALAAAVGCCCRIDGLSFELAPGLHFGLGIGPEQKQCFGFDRPGLERNYLAKVWIDLGHLPFAETRGSDHANRRCRNPRCPSVSSGQSSILKPDVPLFVCKTCLDAVYCSPDCQRAHWPTHHQYHT